MAIERTVGLAVSDEAGYEEYRRQMRPLLDAAAGAFVLDVRVSEVLVAPGDGPIDRLFTIRFPSRAAMEGFFADEAYLAVRAAHFDPSVRSTTTIAIREIADAS